MPDEAPQHRVTTEPVAGREHERRVVCSCGWTGPVRNTHELHQGAFLRLDAAEHLGEQELPW